MNLGRVRAIAGVAAGLGLVGTLIGAFTGEASIWPSYLLAFLFCWGLASGAVALLLLHQLTAGGWGFLIQRPLEAAAKTMPLVLLMFVPVVVGMHDLYHWTHAEAVAADPLLQHKAPYLNTPFFIGRAAFYFVVWMGLTFALVKWSSKPSRLQKISGIGLVIWVLTTTFAAFDWAMSLDPHWFSTIYGLLFVVGQGLGTLAFAIAVLFLLRGTDLDALLNTKRTHDLGKLLFAFVMLWGYMNLSQFIIIWYGNLPEEIVWYVHRTEHGYQGLTLAVVFLQFVIPFFALLSRKPKRRLGVLASIALAILFVRLVDLFWLVMPGGLRPEAGVTIADISAPMMLAGIWLLAFTFLLGQRPLLNREDPRLEEVLHAH
ncbi:MAG: hypothetical protein RIT81_22545 [Deltaproteobacteria bacterium]